MSTVQVFSSNQVVNSQSSQPIDASANSTAYLTASLSGNPVGLLKLQSAVVNPAYNNPAWSDVSGAVVAVSGPGPYSIPKMDIPNVWVRSVYQSTAIGAQSITCSADAGVAQQTQVICVADVSGSLNSTYFLLSAIDSASKAQANFYVWFNINGAGVDPMVANKTGIMVAAATNSSATVIGAAIVAALAAFPGDFSGVNASGTVTITGANPGLVTNASNGGASPGFTISTPVPGVASSLNNLYFFLSSENSVAKYYVWLNVSGLGIDPSPCMAGLGLPVTITGGASSSAVATAVAAAINNVGGGGFFSAVAVSNSVNITMKQAGPFEPARDFNSGFGFSVSNGEGLLSASLVIA